MPINIQSLSDLTQDQVNAAFTTVAQLVQEQNPSVDVKRGVINDLVLYLSSLFSAANQANIDRVRQSNSLLAISQDPTLSDPEIVAAVASNYKVTQGTGSSAFGPVVIILNAAVEQIIPKGAVFSDSAGNTFLSNDTYTARLTSDEVVLPTDKLLTDLGDGTFYFTVNVTSADIGTDKNLAYGTALSPPVVGANILRSYAAASFSGGTDAETNEQLLARLQTGVTSLSLCNRKSIEGLIRSLALPMFDTAFSMSTVGFGDGEQIRYHSILPVAFGGRADSYVRTQALAQKVEVIKTATLVANNSGLGVFQLSFNRDEAPGFYEVIRIQQVNNINDLTFTGYSITSDVRAFDLTAGTTPGTIFFPDITKGLEATYSRYQTATIKFTDTDVDITPLVIGTSTRQYGVVYTIMPGLDEVQDGVSEVSVRSPIGDCLVKAPIPCFVTVSLTFTKKASDTAPDSTVVSNAAAKAVNAASFTGQLVASDITTAVQNVISSAISITAISMSGRLRKPNGSVVTLSSSTVLTVPTDLPNMTSPKTVAFFMNPDDVDITVVSV